MQPILIRRTASKTDAIFRITLLQAGNFLIHEISSFLGRKHLEQEIFYTCRHFFVIMLAGLGSTGQRDETRRRFREVAQTLILLRLMLVYSEPGAIIDLCIFFLDEL